MVRIELPYGTRPCPVELDRPYEVLAAPRVPEPQPIEVLLERALANTRPSADKVTVILSDPTRAEPRAAFLAALRACCPDAQLTLAIATGTHGPCNLDELALPATALRDVRVINHDGHSTRDLVTLGTTTRGTPVQLHRCVLDADLVIATGCIRPHYFAGFGAGVKAIFPGLGEATAIRINHRLKTHAGARAGVVDGNPCREDLEEAVALVPTPTLLVNGVCGPDDRIHAVVVGDLVRTFREGADFARPMFTVRARPAPVVIASDAPPVSTSLYQAAKIFVAVSPLVAPGGTVVVAAQCARGVEPIETVNEAIFRIGVLPRVPPDSQLVLVSDLDEATVRRTLVRYARSVEDVLASTSGHVLVVPRASQLICEATS